MATGGALAGTPAYRRSLHSARGPQSLLARTLAAARRWDATQVQDLKVNIKTDTKVLEDKDGGRGGVAGGGAPRAGRRADGIVAAGAGAEAGKDADGR